MVQGHKKTTSSRLMFNDVQSGLEGGDRNLIQDIDVHEANCYCCHQASVGNRGAGAKYTLTDGQRPGHREWEGTLGLSTVQLRRGLYHLHPAAGCLHMAPAEQAGSQTGSTCRKQDVKQ